MRTKVATCLLLCVLAAGLVSATTLESNRLPSFLEFVFNVPAHVATARPDLYKDTLVAITPNKELKRGAYIEAYLTLSGTVRAAVDEEYRQIMKALKVLRPPKVVPKPAPVIRNKFGVIISDDRSR